MTRGEPRGKGAGLRCQESSGVSWLRPGPLDLAERGHDLQLQDSCWEETLEEEELDLEDI